MSEVMTPSTMGSKTNTTPPTSVPPSSGSMVHQMLSNAQLTQNQSTNDEILVNGQYYAPTGHSVQMATHYFVAICSTSSGALVDGGANGGLTGDDIHVLETDPIAKVDVTGIGEDTFKAFPLSSVQALSRPSMKGNHSHHEQICSSPVQ